ncbi:phospholipase A1-like [Temnothorax curvispinosus]|uniref:phospholipase A1 n=1 Tax=Temnothorax curvispinosus TaxID=300111 RepID=A0A6J1QJ55_9HYME|nr:phospholipase A1-like [Temnothorax curvispinosus]
MQLVAIVSFLVLLCSLFGLMAAANCDLNVMLSNNMKTLMNNDKLSNSCIFGVESVSMVLFTSDIPQGQVVNVNESCDFIDPLKPMIFITHGFLANASTYYFSDFAKLLIKKDYTVFSVDWSNAACYHDPIGLNLLEYPFAVKNTREIGHYLASYVKSMIDTCHVPLKSITFMGHSLGAHISSFAAKDLQRSGYGKIPLLIGTEPAGPLFAHNKCEERFCESDAIRVIALHTSLVGIWHSYIAHLNLWFNNGFSQPPCGGIVIGELNVICAHNIAIVYLANMLFDGCAYVGVPTSPRTSELSDLVPGCSFNRANCIVVNVRIFDSNYSVKGDYCVSVSPEFPYCTNNTINCQEQGAENSITNSIL